MWTMMGLVLLAILIAWLEMRPMWRKRRKRDMVVFSLLMTMGLGLSLLESSSLELPNPLDWISMLYRPIGEAVTQMLT